MGPAVFGTIGAQLATLYLPRFEGYSRTVFAILAILLAIMLTASRASLRPIGEFLCGARAGEPEGPYYVFATCFQTILLFGARPLTSVASFIDLLKDNWRFASPQFIVVMFGIGIALLYVRRFAAWGRRLLTAVVLAYWFLAAPMGA